MFNVNDYFKDCVEDIIDLPEEWENTSNYEQDNLIFGTMFHGLQDMATPKAKPNTAEMQNPSQGWNLGERFISALRDSEIGEKNIYSAMGEQIEFIKIENSNV